MSDAYSIRRATLDDIPIISHQRVAMFQDMGFEDDGALQRMDARFRVWVAEKLTRREYVGWFALAEDQVVAGVGLLLFEWLPSPYDNRPRRGYILNVYTKPEFRRHGLARRLMLEALAYCREQDIVVVTLHASGEGRPVYDALGFDATNEMRIILN